MSDNIKRTLIGTLIIIVIFWSGLVRADIGPDQAGWVVMEILNGTGYISNVESVVLNGRKQYVVHYIYSSGESRNFTVDAESGQLLY